MCAGGFKAAIVTSMTGRYEKLGFRSCSTVRGGKGVLAGVAGVRIDGFDGTLCPNSYSRDKP